MHIDASESARSQDKVLKFPAMRVCGRFGRPRILLASACLFAAPRGSSWQPVSRVDSSGGT